MIGHTVADRYRIEREIGRGGFATVYLATDTRLNRPVALKLLERREEAFIQQFAREAQAVARLNHPHIITISDYGQEGSGYYLVMPYLSGGDLAERLQQKSQPYAIAEALTILSQIAAALDYAHSQNIIHRDVKPANILFDDKDQAVLTDFGLVKAAAESAAPGSTWMQQWDSDKNSLAGTVAYMAPEQTMLGRRVDKATDIYALGVIAYELMTGVPPFSGETDEIAEAHRSQPPPDPRQIAPRLPVETARLIQQALAKEPTERPASAGEFALQLAERYYGAEIEAYLQRGEYQPALSGALTFQRQFPQSKQGAAWAEAAERGIQAQAQETLVRAQAEAERLEKAAAQEADAVARRAREKAASPHWSVWAGAAGLLLAGCILLFIAGNWLLNRSDAEDAVANGAPVSQATPTPDNTPSPRAAVDGTPTPTPTPQAGDIQTVALPTGGRVEMVYIPAGSFIMGSDSAEARDREKPAHETATGAYWLDRLPVTNAQFAAFVENTGHRTTAEEEGTGRVARVTETGAADWQSIAGANWRTPHGPDSVFRPPDDHPVVQVSWHGAAAFCEWRGARLPTEAEWEKAARGEDGRIYPWGDQFIGANLNYCDQNCPFSWRDAAVDDGYPFTSPVGSYPARASPYGALDMAGNAWEWTDSWFIAYPGNTDEDETYGETYRVLRGGSWFSSARLVRASNRDGGAPDSRYDDIGFRCASSAP